MVPVRRRNRDLFACDLDQRVFGDLARHRGCEALAVDRQRTAGRCAMFVAAGHDQRAEPSHLGMQQANGIVFEVIGPE